MGSNTTDSSRSLNNALMRRRIRGFSLEILRVLLNKNPVSVSELATMLGKSSNYVRAYLYNLKRYGYVDYSYGYWYLKSDFRDDIARLESLLSKHSNTPRVRALSREYIVKLLDNYGLSSEAKIIALKLIDNFVSSGYRRKYIVITEPYQLEYEFNLRVDDVREAIRELESRGIVYRYNVKGYGLKLGLMKGFIDELMGSN